MVFCLDGYQTPTYRPSPPKMKTLKVSSQLVYSVFKENELCNHLSSLAIPVLGFPIDSVQSEEGPTQNVASPCLPPEVLLDQLRYFNTLCSA